MPYVTFILSFSNVKVIVEVHHLQDLDSCLVGY